VKSDSKHYAKGRRGPAPTNTEKSAFPLELGNEFSRIASASREIQQPAKFLTACQFGKWSSGDHDASLFSTRGTLGCSNVHPRRFRKFSFGSANNRSSRTSAPRLRKDRGNYTERRSQMGLILLIILILLVLGAVPAWPHSRGWGYYPSGGLGLVLVIVLILVLMQRI
jgi:Protein of unknown function (DUF3309)